jgi:phage terminase large subunit-like protein
MLKTYEQGWQKWQGTAPHVVWMDEEPDDYKIYSEAQTRTLTSGGINLVTFTPLLGVTDLVEHFMTGGGGIYLKSATWDDVPHLKKEDKERLAASYRTHERDARTKGIPMMGEGAIFPISDDRIVVEPFAIPSHFARLKGVDFGFEHHAAGVEIAWDRGQDVIYVVDCYKAKGELAPYHAAWFNKTNKWIPVAWPHDGMNTSKGGGPNVKDAYAQHGVNMLSKSARYQRSFGSKEKAGGQDQWPVIDEVRERMMTGRFKVFSNLSSWFEEKRSYHVKGGADGAIKIVDRRDDVLKATFYAVMMKRYAVSADVMDAPQKPTGYYPIATSRL